MRIWLLLIAAVFVAVVVIFVFALVKFLLLLYHIFS